MNPDTLEREENILQLNMEINDLQIKKTELIKQLEKKYEDDNKILFQITHEIRQVKSENIKLNAQFKEYETQIEFLTKNIELLRSQFYERGDVRFVVLADIHAGGPKGNDRPAVKESVNWTPDFVILAGDLVYGNGFDEKEWIILSENLAPVITANIPIYPVIGNHDGYFPATQEDTLDPGFPIWTQVPDWAVDIGKGWYSFIIDDVKIVVVENNFKHTWNCENFDDFGLVSEQREYIEAELNKPSKWVFIASHK